MALGDGVKDVRAGRRRGVSDGRRGERVVNALFCVSLLRLWLWVRLQRAHRIGVIDLEMRGRARRVRDCIVRPVRFVVVVWVWLELKW